MADGMRVVVSKFGEPGNLQVESWPVPEPGPGEIRVRLTSIGMNHAELMARRGEYKLSSGEPPFVPGLEGGGVVDALGAGSPDALLGTRVILAPEATRGRNESGGQEGSYRSHFICRQDQAIPAPDEIPDEQLGAIWLAYLTAWGCLIWKQGLRPGQVVAIPAASSSVGLAAAQIVAEAGAVPIGLTSSPEKLSAIRALPENRFAELMATRDADGKPSKWRRTLMDLTAGHGVDIVFDPVGGGDYLNTEIQCLAQHGTIWVYGLLGIPGVVDVSPLIRKHGAIRGWVLNELSSEGGSALQRGIDDVLGGFRKGAFRQHVAQTFPLRDVQKAHAIMEEGSHIGKLVLIP